MGFNCEHFQFGSSAKSPVKSMGITRSWSISVLEKWCFGAQGRGRYLVWVVAFFMNSLHSAVLSFLLIFVTCVACFTDLLLVEKGKNLEGKWFNLLLLGCLSFSQDSSLVVACKILVSKNFLIVNQLSLGSLESAIQMILFFI